MKDDLIYGTNDDLPEIQDFLNELSDGDVVAEQAGPGVIGLRSVADNKDLPALNPGDTILRSPDAPYGFSVLRGE